MAQKNSKCHTDSKMHWSKVETPQALSINLCAAVVENGIFLFLPIIIRRHTADFLAREFDFLYIRGEQICKFPTLDVQSHCISVMQWAISISAMPNINICAGTRVVISKNKYLFYNIILPLLLI